MRLLVVVDSKPYAFSEVYQSKLHEALRRDHECVYAETESKTIDSNASFDGVFCCVKARNVLRHADFIKRVSLGRQIVIQDYDPWRFLADDQPYTGVYSEISKRLNVVNFFVPSKSWRDVARDLGHGCVWSPIGLSPSNVSHGNRFWKDRKIDIEFRGSEYDTRSASFRALKESGFDVPWKKDKISPYSEFLTHLNNVKVWAHDESLKFYVKGKAVESNWLWPKACEILSRGCFLVRDRQTELFHYELDVLPTLLVYSNINEAKNVYDDLLSIDDNEKDSVIRESIDRLRKIDHYADISKKISAWFSIKNYD